MAVRRFSFSVPFFLRDAIFTLSRDETITSLNLAFKTLTGWSRAEWLGKPFASLIHPDDLPLARELCESVLQGGEPPIFELRVLVKSGGYVVGQFLAPPQWHTRPFDLRYFFLKVLLATTQWQIGE